MLTMIKSIDQHMHKNENFELQGNANGFQSQLIINVLKVPRNLSVVDISRKHKAIAKQ